MNKPVTPKQLSLVPHDGVNPPDNPKVDQGLPDADHFDDIQPMKSSQPDNIEVAAILSKTLAAIAPPDNEEFNWNTDDSVILKEQRATAVYYNKVGELIIRQQAAWNDEGDTFVYVTPENVTAFLEAAAKKARE